MLTSYSIKLFILIFFFLLASLFSSLASSKIDAAIISPDKYYVDLQPGESKSFELKVLGDARQPDDQILYVYTMTMVKTGEEDDREFNIPNLNDEAEPANWIKLQNSQILLSAGDIVSIPFTINVNSIARCGTNLAAIFVSSSPRDTSKVNNNDAQESLVGIKNSIVSQVHINVNEPNSKYCGEVKSRLNLLEFKIDTQFPVFNYDNIPFVTRISNEGNLLSQSPKGFIEIFGTGSKITIPFNQEDLDIYPGTTRKFTNSWVDPNYPVNGNFVEQLIYELTHFRFGQYEARLGVTFNVSPKIVSSIYLWIIPWRIVTVVLIFILIFTIFIVRDRRKSKELKTLKASSRK